MYPSMTIEGLGVLCVDCTDTVDRYQLTVVKLRYGAGQGVPILSEAWMCPTATANLFDNSSSYT